MWERGRGERERGRGRRKIGKSHNSQKGEREKKYWEKS